MALQRARHQMDSGMALTCRSRVPFRVPDVGVMASVSVSAFIRLASVVDVVMTLSWRESPVTMSLPCPIEFRWYGGGWDKGKV